MKLHFYNSWLNWINIVKLFLELCPFFLELLSMLHYATKWIHFKQTWARQGILRLAKMFQLYVRVASENITSLQFLAAPAIVSIHKMLG